MRRLTIPVFLALSVCLPVACARAQGKDPAEKKVSVDLHNTPLRKAIEKLFEGTGLQYAIEPAVPDVPITLTLKDTPFRDAVSRLVRIANVQAPGLTYALESGIYIFRVRRK
jgi:type II secretory pathway component GspD/PulD (secretin)